ncbi:MAG: biotin--[acetyl-CoA-carboxylase] ligase [Muribaculaceae bacterium]|nr:biotin--[acetyl-CoA-carboxylase] ligase [Muribaculaceae bacterium]
MKIIHLEVVDSTNEYVMREAPTLEAPVMVVAHTQTAGQGQRGNTWESAPGQNLTFTVFYRPAGLPPMAQFSMSEAVALAVVDLLAEYGIDAKVKWPNDIYVADRKICGILIRHSIMGGSISYSVIGAGINVNQTAFLSDAPNPVSMRQLTGSSYSLPELEAEMAEHLERRLQRISDPAYRGTLHEEFKRKLWRGDGELYQFRDTATGQHFKARIDEIALHGPISLRLADGTMRTYAFKEVAFE